MPDPIRLLGTLHRAVALFRDTAGRRGRVVSLHDALDVMVVGDLHGHIENFRQALLRAELAKNPGRHLVFQEVVHGPFRYPDGSDKSHQLLDLLAALKCEHPFQIQFLLGNHELSQWTGRRIAKDDEDLNDLFHRGVFSAYGAHASQIYDAYLDLFAVVPLAVRTPNRVFVSHSVPSSLNLTSNILACLEKKGPAEADLLPGGCIHSLVWGRDVSDTNVEAFLRHVDADHLITGHIPADGGFALPNSRQIILDAMKTPAGYCLFPTDRPLTHAELVACVKTF
jgi:hypothetical protein